MYHIMKDETKAYSVIEMTQKELDKLPEYSLALPANIYSGFRFKAFRSTRDDYVVGEYKSEKGQISLQWNEVKIIE